MSKCATCEDSCEVVVTHYWDANGNEQEFQPAEFVSCPKCSKEEEEP